MRPVVDVERKFGIPNTSVVLEFKCVRNRPTCHKHDETELSDEIKEYCLREAVRQLSVDISECG
jgi:hypothetical protein